MLAALPYVSLYFFSDEKKLFCNFNFFLSSIQASNNHSHSREMATETEHCISKKTAKDAGVWRKGKREAIACPQVLLWERNMLKERMEQLRGNIWKNPKQEPMVTVQHHRGGPGNCMDIRERGGKNQGEKPAWHSHFRGAGKDLWSLYYWLVLAEATLSRRAWHSLSVNYVQNSIHASETQNTKWLPMLRLLFHGKVYSPTLLSLSCCSWTWKPLAAFQSCQGKSRSSWLCNQNSSRMGPSPLQFILHPTQSPTLCWEVEFTCSPQYPLTL